MDKLPQLPQAHGVLVLNKPKGPSSARCLTSLKRMGQKKIGHAGTLDPMASGVLLVLLGHATKISNYLMEGGGKVYSGCLRLGQATDTWDAQGRVLEEKAWDHI
ncbi:MAG: tRNA pseudouridine(55) synthase, partial [Deltaproteobacteria bacterium]|nr:tRNA pseudouridine(55) synthase [Deltaproteobacteria bacterium]